MKDEYIYLGPRCEYNADTPICPTGQSWEQLEAQREANRSEIQKNKDYQRQALGLDPVPVDPFQQYAHPFLVGKALEDTLKQLSKKSRTIL